MPVMRYVGISSLAAALRSPNSGVKLPLLVPYFLWKQRLPHPSTCCPPWKAPSGPPSLLCSFCLRCCYSDRPPHFASNHSISNGCSRPPCWWLFFNVVQQSDNCDRLTHLGRVVIFTANFLDEDFFYKSFKMVYTSSRNCTTNSMLCVLKKLPSWGPPQMAESVR